MPATDQTRTEEAQKIIAFIQDVDNTRSNLEQLRAIATDYFWNKQIYPALLEATQHRLEEYIKQYPALRFEPQTEKWYWQLRNTNFPFRIHLEWAFYRHTDFIGNGCVCQEGTWLPLEIHVEWDFPDTVQVNDIYLKLKEHLGSIIAANQDKRFHLNLGVNPIKKKNSNWQQYVVAAVQAKQDIPMYKVDEFVSHLFDWEGTQKIISLLADDTFLEEIRPYFSSAAGSSSAN